MKCASVSRRNGTWLAAFGAVALGGALMLASVKTDAAATPVPIDSPAYKQAMSLSDAFRQTAVAVQPSVVTITSETQVAGRGQLRAPGMDQEELFKRFFGDRPLEEFFDRGPGQPHRFHKPSAMPQPVQRGIGSGVVIDADGLILTNNHVVADADDVRVKLSDGREFQAREVMTDPKTDLAVLKIEASGLTAARLGDSERVEIGDWVLALGQPFGLEGTVTAGIISAKGRGIGITARENFLQTDAAINPGNSGGPLVNLAGEVIGINTAISSRSGGNDGVGFAIPVNLAKWVSDQLVSTGTVRRAFLGVGIQKVTHDLASRFGIEGNRGVLITQVQEGSPAAKADLQVGDVILQFAGKDVSSPRELQNLVERHEPGSTQEVVISREGKRQTLQVACGEQANDGEAVSHRSSSTPLNELGFRAGELTSEVAKRLELDNSAGVVITEVQPGSEAARAGLKTGMVVAEVNRRPVKNLSDFREAIAEREEGRGLLLLIRTANGSRFVVVNPS